MGKQIIRILLGVAILIGSMNLPGAYFSKKEDVVIKTLESSYIKVNEKKKSTKGKKKKTYDISPLALLKNFSSTINKITN